MLLQSGALKKCVVAGILGLFREADKSTGALVWPQLPSRKVVVVGGYDGGGSSPPPHPFSPTLKSQIATSVPAKVKTLSFEVLFQSTALGLSHCSQLEGFSENICATLLILKQREIY